MPQFVPAVVAAATGAAVGGPLAGTAFLASVVPGSVVAGSAVAAAGLTSALIQLAAGTALSALSTALQRQKGGAAGGGGVVTQVEFGETATRVMMLGQSANAGRLLFAGSHGKVGGAPNAIYSRAFALSDWPGEVRRWFINGAWEKDEPEWVKFPDTGYTAGHPIAAFRGDAGRDHLYYRTKGGGQLAVFGGWDDVYSDADFPWTAECVGRGMLMAGETAIYNASVHQRLPHTVAEIQGAPLYDLRKDSSRDGSGSHRWGDQESWEYTRNPIVMVYNILAGIRDPITDRAVWGGEIPLDMIDAATFIAAANTCDTPRSDGGLLFRAGYALRFDAQTTPADVIEDLLDACQCKVMEIAGKWYVTTPWTPDAVVSITDADIIISAPESDTPFPGLLDTTNGIQISIPHHQTGYQMREAPLYQPAEYLEADEGRSQVARLQFPAVYDMKQAERLQKTLLDRSRRMRKHAIVLPPEFYKLAPGDAVSWTSRKRGYEGKKFLVLEMSLVSEGLIAVVLEETNPNDKDEPVYSTRPEPVAVRPPVLPFPDVFTFSAATIKDNDGVTRRPAIRAEWNPDLVEATGVRFQFYPEDSTDETPEDAAHDFNDGDATALGIEARPGVPVEVRTGVDASVRLEFPASKGTAKIPVALPDTWYLIRARFRNDDKKGPWCDYVRVRSPAARIQEADIDDGAVSTDKVQDGAISNLGHTQRNDVVETARGTYEDFDTLTISRRSGKTLWMVISTSWTGGNTTDGHDWRLMVSGAQIKHWIHHTSTVRGSSTMQFEDNTEREGVVTYTLQVRIDAGTPAGFEIDDMDWHAQEFSK